MKKIVITGSQGQLGRDCEAVFKDSCDLVLIDLADGDLSIPEQAAHLLGHHAPDVIINCAAYTAVDACESDENCWGANEQLPRNLAQWAAAHNTFLLHVSTDYVFDGTKPLFEAWSENDITNPLSEYGRSKRAGEMAIQKEAGRYAIVRTAWLYSHHGANFLKTMLRLAEQTDGAPLKVVQDQFGSPTWTRTLAKQIRQIVEHEITGVIHATSEGYGSWYDFAVAIFNEMGIDQVVKPCDSSAYPTPAQRPKNSILENETLKRAEINQFKDWRAELRHFVQENHYHLR